MIAALGQSALLLAVGTYAAIEGIRRLFEPPEVPASELLIFGLVGLVANIIAITILASSRGATICAPHSSKCSTTRSAPSG